MAINAEAGSVIYETNKNGEKMLVRSLQSNERAYLRFTNKTNRPVDVWWRNFKGVRVHYVRLLSWTMFDVDSFITHPWEFTDVSTKENYVVGNKRIFRPPKEIADKRFRTNWNITIGVRSLRQTALLTIVRQVHDSHVASQLQLPRVLEEDLRETITVYHRAIIPDLPVHTCS